MRPNSQTVAADVKWFISESKPRKLKSMREFAGQEIVPPCVRIRSACAPPTR